MLAKLRNRAEDESGFTLIELLVVILIIGILAAVAIPTFLNQRGKAYDSNAQTVAKDAQIAEETYASSNNGSYVVGAGALTSLQAIDPSLNNVAAGNATSSEPGMAIAAAPSGGGYQIVVQAQNTLDNFTLTETAAGQTSFTCNGTSANGGPGACGAGGSW
jgi:type IV pilus assembly protein PilA